MARNRQVRPPTAVVPEDAVTVSVSIVGVKFTCLVEKEWPCESLVASAIAEYHLAYPTCEVPDCSVIFHVGKKEPIAPKDPVGKWCRDGDEIELGMNERPTSTNATDPRPTSMDDSLQFHTYDFTVVFHRLPLGFTLKQEMDATVVGMIYPKSAATHYERLAPGVVVVKIGDTPLESLGLRQVHEVIRNCTLPLHIRFRGWKKPVARRSSFSGVIDAVSVLSPRGTTAAPESVTAPPTQRRKSVPNRHPQDLENTRSTGNIRSRSNTVTSTTSASATTPAAAPDDEENTRASEQTAQSASTPSPYSQSKQRLTSERKKTNASSPYPEHRAVAAERRARRDSVGMDLSVPLTDQLDTCSNQGDSPSTSSPSAIAELKMKQKEYHVHGTPALTKATDVVASVDSMTDKLAATRIGEGSQEAVRDVANCDADSNQNEDESEEMLAKHIKILQTELAKKYEEAKILADQLEKYHARLAAVQSARVKRGSFSAAKATTADSAVTTPSTVQKRASAPRLTLTPEVLEAIDTKAGLPPKDDKYAGSNASSVSGYSNYSNRSAVAKRHSQQLSRFVGKTGDNSNPLRGDASVSSGTSSTRRRHGSFSGESLKSPRSQCVQNINNRYNYIPPTYAANDKFYDAPSSFSTKGGLISRAKATRDSYIKIPDTPGVGAYDVKAPREKVRGGEIGDSDRSLPWP